MKEKKKKREKITYIDDGRSLADMSGVKGGGFHSSRSYWTPRASLKEQWQTYWGAVKMMFVPMLVVIGVIIFVYMLFLLLSLIS